MTYSTDIPPIKNCAARHVFLIVSLILVAVWVYLLWIARSLEATPFDTYEIYIDAKIFSGLDHLIYHWKRPPLLPWLLTPFFHFFSLQTAKTISQILAVFFYGGLTLGSYKIFRLFAGPLKALLGASLLALNPLVLHHAPFLKEDIPATALATLTFWLYLKSRMQKNVLPYALTGLAIALAGSTRYNMLPWMLSSIVLYELLSVSPGPASWKNLATLRINFFWPKTFFLLIFPVLFVSLFISFSWAVATQTKGVLALTDSFRSLWIYYSKLMGSGDSPIENLFFFWNAFTGPGIFLCIIGILVSWLRKIPGALWMNLWLFTFSLQQLSLTHFEARYLFPAFPPICFFMVIGASALIASIHKLSRKIKLPDAISSRLGIACLALCLLLYGYVSVAELLKFQDPFYRVPYMKKVSMTAAALAHGKNIFWVGAMYPTRPKQFVFHPKDAAGYIYHFYSHTVRFYTGNRVFVIATDNKQIYEKGHRLFVSEALRRIKDGDVLIINPNPQDYSTIDLPEKILPLFVQKCRVVEFNPLPEKDGRRTFVAKNIGGFLQSEKRGPQIYVEGSGLPDGTYELYARRKAGDEPYWIDTLSVKNGELPSIVAPGQNVDSYFLLTYTPPISFPQP